MKIQTVNFDSFRSLVNKELRFDHRCMGLVGINESGKTNVLRALAVLSDDRQLTKKDTPKLYGQNLPCVRFLLQLSRIESTQIKDEIQKELDIEDNFWPDHLEVELCVRYDGIKENEIRTFKVLNLNIPDETRYLSSEYRSESLKVLKNGRDIPFDRALLLNETDISENEKRIIASRTAYETTEELDLIETQLETIEREILEGESQKEANTANEDVEKTVQPELSEEPEDDLNLENTGDYVDPDPVEPKVIRSIADLKNEKKYLSRKRTDLRKKIEKFQELTGGYNPWALLQESLTNASYWQDNAIANSQAELASIKEEIDAVETKIEEFPVPIAAADVQEHSDCTEILNKLIKKNVALTSRVKKLEQDLVKAQNVIGILDKPFAENYSKNCDDLSEALGSMAFDTLKSLLPKVVRWEHSPEFILAAETSYKEINDKKAINTLSRPLVNLFRIGLNISTLAELKKLIKEISESASERSRTEKRLNKKINEYMDKVWPGYGQKIEVTLERAHVYVHIYDPKCDNASHFEMQERSQGSQTFISFLLTIAAEANVGLIKDTLLLLDEPETHLHPIGVRHMLRRLIEAGVRGNDVVYATHSVFMIDRDNYDRHVVVSKKEEQTDLRPSMQNRIGCFLQEEVLYGALQINLNEEFSAGFLVNLVFEGIGDGALFRCFYESCVSSNKKKPFDLNEMHFFHGGKCTDMKKLFAKKSLQLGTKWLFILDNDNPAHDLRTMIESRYKQYMNSDVYVFQYTDSSVSSTDNVSFDVDLEKLLPESILSAAIDKAKQSVSDLTGELLPDYEHDSNYLEYLKLMRDAEIEPGSIDSFKTVFKQSLNSEIAEKCASIKSTRDFETEFPKYFLWAKNVIKLISEPSVS